MAPNYAGLGPADYQDVVGQKLPPTGLAWPRRVGSIFQGFWNVFANGLAAFHAASAQLTEVEAFPPTSVQLLPRWEGVLDLPDPCLGTNPVTSARQAAVQARLAATGGQSVPYYEDLASNLGGSISITEYAPWRWGVDPLWAPLRCEAWANVWLVTLLGDAAFVFQWGVSATWEPFWTIANGPIQCEIQRLSPAHTHVNFTLF